MNWLFASVLRFSVRSFLTFFSSVSVSSVFAFCFAIFFAFWEGGGVEGCFLGARALKVRGLCLKGAGVAFLRARRGEQWQLKGVWLLWRFS